MGAYDMVIAKLKAARLTKGWSQAELAKRLGATDATISYYENGRRRPSIDFVEAWAGALGLAVVVDVVAVVPVTEVGIG